MIFTFSPENSFNVPDYSRTYSIDVTNETVEKVMEYEHIREFNKIHATLRHSANHIVKGNIISELTFANEAWSWLTGCLLGTRREISGYKFKTTNEKWGILIGYLSADLANDSTSFVIDEKNVGDFDSVDAVIVNDEVIDVASISNGVVSSSTRGFQGTAAISHEQKDLVYGIVLDANRKIVITSRVKSGRFYADDMSITAVLDRDGTLFGYSGVKIENMAINFRVFDSITVTTAFLGADSTNDMELSASAASDDGDIVGLTDIAVYSEHATEHLRQFFVQLHNTLKPAGFGFTSTVQDFITEKTSTFGVITWRDDSLDNVLNYEQNAKRHFSVSLGEGNYRMVLAMNNVRVNTVAHFLDDDLLIQDSAPWYMYANPVIMYQL